MAVKARYSPDGVWIRIPGLLPNLKIFPSFGRSSDFLAATTLDAEDSITFGGFMKRKIGYSTAPRVAAAPEPSRKLSIRLRAFLTGSSIWNRESNSCASDRERSQDDAEN